MNSSRYLNPLVSIIILNWNRCEDVVETLDHVLKLNYENLEIILIDNGSTDNSVEVLSQYKSIKLIALPKNIGCEDGNNVGILNANGEILIFLDSDADLETDGIKKILNVFNEDTEIGIVEPKIIRPSDNKILNEPRYWPTRNAFTGCVVAIKSSVFKKIGLRPGEFFLYSSEPDICLRAIESGYKIIHSSEIIGRHRESPHARANKRFYHLATRNLTWVIWRHYPIKSAIYETLILFLVHAVRSAKHFAFHFYLLGIFEAIYYFRSGALAKRKPLKRYNEARLFPGFRDLIGIFRNKYFSKEKGSLE